MEKNQHIYANLHTNISTYINTKTTLLLQVFQALSKIFAFRKLTKFIFELTKVQSHVGNFFVLPDRTMILDGLWPIHVTMSCA